MIYLYVPKTVDGGMLIGFEDAEEAARMLNDIASEPIRKTARILSPAEAETVRAIEFPERSPIDLEGCELLAILSLIIYYFQYIFLI
jgi:hypothetical protein